MQSFDVVIAGGGMVGLALACGLQGSGLRVAVLENQQPDLDSPLPEQPGLRVSAINAASERLVKYIGVWDNIIAQRANAYQGMEVWDRDSFGKIAFRGEEYGFSHLGHIIENQVIHRALWQRAEQSSDITLLAPATLKNVAWGENEAFITLSDDRQLTARLVVGADGAQSWLRQHADIPLTFWDYRIMHWLRPSALKSRTSLLHARSSTVKAFWHFCRWPIPIYLLLSGQFRRMKRSA